jgi:hypothetical protein
MLLHLYMHSETLVAPSPEKRRLSRIHAGCGHVANLMVTYEELYVAS